MLRCDSQEFSMNDACIVFDLDDTLYKEIDFLKSGYKHIAGNICRSSTQRNKIEALELYRYVPFPNIIISED